MRIIKFRAWDKMGKLWIDNRDLAIQADGTPLFGGEYPDTTWQETDAWEPIIMQYTGLKDKNGKEIYEGDICNTHLGGDFPYQRVVEMKKDRPEIKFIPETGSILCEGNMKDTEVIGNIYENKELL